MFDQTFVGMEKRANRPLSMAVSLTMQIGVVGLLLLIPLLRPEGPLLRLDAPPVIYRANLIGEPVKVIVSRGVIKAPHIYSIALRAPRTVPTAIEAISDAPDVSGFGAIPSAIPGAVMSHIVSGLPERLPPVQVKTPPVKAEVPPPPTAPLRVSTSVQSALLKFGPKPLYPPLAKAARVQGSVRLTAVIGTNGGIRDLRVISGPPLLVKASLETVSTWRYQPTLLNGLAVEVVTEVDVNFTLSQ